MVVVPEAIPLTIPVEPMVATEVFVEVHTPPLTASLNVVVVPGQSVVVPVIVPGFADGVTVKVLTAIQPVGAV